MDGGCDRCRGLNDHSHLFPRPPERQSRPINPSGELQHDCVKHLVEHATRQNETERSWPTARLRVDVRYRIASPCKTKDSHETNDRHDESNGTGEPVAVPDVYAHGAFCDGARLRRPSLQNAQLVAMDPASARAGVKRRSKGCADVSIINALQGAKGRTPTIRPTAIAVKRDGIRPERFI